MKICFIGPEISNVFEGEILGGAQKQQALMIEGFKANGFDVVILEYYLTKYKRLEGIDFYPAWSKVNSSFYMKIVGIYKQIVAKDVDIVYARGTQLYGAIIYFFLKIFKPNIKLVWGVAGDHDLTSRYNNLRTKHASSLYEKLNLGMIFTLSSNILFYFSDVVVCQTEEQFKKSKLKSKNKKVTIISNIYSNNSNNKLNLTKTVEYDAIWIGKFTGIKGEDVLLKISKDIPKIRILCLGHVSEEFSCTNIFEEIKCQENLFLKGRVRFEEVPDYISKADFILNTSPSEGLSNVFLEGWNQEKPVISFVVNPNKYLTKEEGGYCAQGSYLELIGKLKSIIQNRKFMSYHGKKGKQIINENHLPKYIFHKYVNLFNDIG